MAKIPPPLNSPICSDKQTITTEWADWFQQILKGVVYQSAPTGVTVVNADTDYVGQTWQDWLLKLPSAVRLKVVYPPAPLTIKLFEKDTKLVHPVWADWFIRLQN